VSGEPPQPAPLVRDLAPTRPFIAPEELARRSGRASLIRLGANESAFGPPSEALAAMRAEIERASWYGDPESMELREALAARHGCHVENITVGAGIDDLLGLAVRAYLAPGDVSVATLGSYPTYAYHVTGYGATLATVPYRDDGSIDLEGLAARAHATRARHVYLANPDNPSGSFAPASDVRAFADALPPGALFVLDEAYGDFVPAPELLAEPIDPRIVRMRTFSKAFGLAGARIAYCIADRSVIAAFAKIRLQFGVNRIAQAGALAALGAHAYVADVVREVERGRADYEALGARLGLGTIPSRTNFVCFDLGTRARAEAMVDALLERGVFIRKPGAAPLDRYVRVTVGTESERAAFATSFAEALALAGANPATCP